MIPISKFWKEEGSLHFQLFIITQLQSNVNSGEYNIELVTSTTTSEKWRREFGLPWFFKKNEKDILKGTNHGILVLRNLASAVTTTNNDAWAVGKDSNASKALKPIIVLFTETKMISILITPQQTILQKYL